MLECLFTPLADELLAMRSAFLSRLVYQTYNGYVMSQFKRMQAHIRNQGTVKWKHVMHLVRLLISGTHVLRAGVVPVRVEEHREALRAIKNGEVPWDEVNRWRLEFPGRSNFHADSLSRESSVQRDRSGRISAMRATTPARAGCSLAAANRSVADMRAGRPISRFPHSAQSPPR